MSHRARESAQPGSGPAAPEGQSSSHPAGGEGAPKPPAPLEINDVSVRSVTASSVEVVWRTNLRASTQGARGLASTPVLWSPLSQSSLEHQTLFAGLGGGTAYHLWLRARDEYGQLAETELVVATAPPDDTTQFTTAGDAILANGEPTIPTMLWDLCASDVGAKLTLGINLFMGNSCGPDSELVTRLEGRGYAVVDNSSADDTAVNVVGTYYPDEWDAFLADTVRRQDIEHAIVSPQTGRLSFLTLTNHFYSRAEPLPQGKGMYPVLYTIPDVIGFDLYPLQGWCRPAFADVYDAQRELHTAAGGKPTFQWIEAAAMEHQCSQIRALDPTPATVRAETWLAIAGGADGVGYFPNNWSPEVADEISRSNWQIKELSPALLADDLPATADPAEVKVAAQTLNGALYIIAINTTTSDTSAQIRVPDLDNRKLDALGEDRTVIAAADSFRDAFEPLAVHIYVAPPQLWADPAPGVEQEPPAPQASTSSSSPSSPDISSAWITRE